MTWAVLIFASLALAAVSGFAWAAIAATRGQGKQDARATELAVRLEVSMANTKIQSARADAGEERANGLDALIDEMAAFDDPAVARAHVLSRRSRKAGATDARRGGAGEVQGGGLDPAVASGSDDALLKPGE